MKKLEMYEKREGKHVLSPLRGRDDLETSPSIVPRSPRAYRSHTWCLQVENRPGSKIFIDFH